MPREPFSQRSYRRTRQPAPSLTSVSNTGIRTRRGKETSIVRILLIRDETPLMFALPTGARRQPILKTCSLGTGEGNNHKRHKGGNAKGTRFFCAFLCFSFCAFCGHFPVFLAGPSPLGFEPAIVAPHAEAELSRTLVRAFLNDTYRDLIFTIPTCS
jgi:hypothetical protein